MGGGQDKVQAPGKGAEEKESQVRRGPREPGTLDSKGRKVPKHMGWSALEESKSGEGSHYIEKS